MSDVTSTTTDIGMAMKISGIPTPLTPRLDENYPFKDAYSQMMIQNSETRQSIAAETGRDPMAGGKSNKFYVKMKSDGSVRLVRYDGKKKYILYNNERVFLSSKNKGKYVYV